MADQLVEKLKEYGCDVDSALDRFMNKESLYLKFIRKFPDDPTMNTIRELIHSENTEERFKAVHTMKGVAGNLGLTPLFDTSADMVQKFRENKTEEAIAEYDTLEKIYKEIYDIISESL